MQNEKVSLWALSIADYNCKTEYLAGTANLIADLLSRFQPDIAQDGESSPPDLDISRNTYQISALNTNRFHPQDFASCRPEFQDCVEKPVFQKSLDIALEQDKDETNTRSKQAAISNSLSPGGHRQYLLSENILYCICVYISQAIYNMLFLPNTIVSPGYR